MHLSEAAHQAWPPFVLVTGLLLIGIVAHADGLFEHVGGLLERLPGGSTVLLGASTLVVVAVTAVLNLDTAVVFLTPVIVIAARRRQVDEQPFLYAAVFVANASSLYLPGSNLTNLLVLSRDPISGGTFAARFLAPALAATVATAAGLYLLFRSRLRAGPRPAPNSRVSPAGGRLGMLGALAAAGLTLGLPQPALPVLGVGLVAVAIEVARRRLRLGHVVRAVGPGVLLALFLTSVALGVLARSWGGPAQLIAGAGRWETAAIGAVAAIVLNNLPATVLLSAHALPHPRALLIGLNIGPNLAVTGSLSAYLWIRAARQIGASPSIKAFSRRGIVLAPLAILAALSAASVFSTPN
jgi:arsenical pump membrane protein